MQSKAELETWYRSKDPWEYETTADDEMRKRKILDTIKKHRSHYKRALDVGAGEGFITRDLPAEVIHAVEVSDNASLRLKTPISRVLEPEGEYDLIIATGVFYSQYDWKQMQRWILDHASGLVLTCNIKEWEHPLPITPFYEEEFKYRNYTQHLCLYEFSTQ